MHEVLSSRSKQTVREKVFRLVLMCFLRKQSECQETLDWIFNLVVPHYV